MDAGGGNTICRMKGTPRAGGTCAGEVQDENKQEEEEPDKATADKVEETREMET